MTHQYLIKCKSCYSYNQLYPFRRYLHMQMYTLHNTTYLYMHAHVCTHTVNNKSSVVQNFHGSLVFQQNVGKTVAVLLNYNAQLNKPLKLVEKTFAFYPKSAKTAKVLYRGGFIVYGICTSMHTRTHARMHTHNNCYDSLQCRCSASKASYYQLVLMLQVYVHSQLANKLLQANHN